MVLRIDVLAVTLQLGREKKKGGRGEGGGNERKKAGCILVKMLFSIWSKSTVK